MAVRASDRSPSAPYAYAHTNGRPVHRHQHQQQRAGKKNKSIRPETHASARQAETPDPARHSLRKSPNLTVPRRGLTPPHRIVFSATPLQIQSSNGALDGPKPLQSTQNPSTAAAAVRQSTLLPGQGTSSRLGTPCIQRIQSINQSLGNEPAHNSAFMPPKQCCNPAPIGRATQADSSITGKQYRVPPPRSCSTSSMYQISLPNGAGSIVARSTPRRAPEKKKATAQTSPQHRTGRFGNTVWTI